MQTKRNAMSIIEVKKELDVKRGVAMIEKMLEKHKGDLPEGKSIKDFGGGYVEMLKTKAKVVLYFGFDHQKNRVSIKFQVKQTDVLLWCEAISEKIWNNDKQDEIISFDDEEVF